MGNDQPLHTVLLIEWTRKDGPPVDARALVEATVVADEEHTLWVNDESEYRGRIVLAREARPREIELASS